MLAALATRVFALFGADATTTAAAAALSVSRNGCQGVSAPSSIYQSMTSAFASLPS